MIHEDKRYNVPSGYLEDIIPEDEPVFLIRGKDKFARGIIHLWIALNEDKMTPKKIMSLKAHAERMRKWAIEHKKKEKTEKE